MILKICAYEDVDHFVTENWPDYLISLVDSDFEWESIDEEHHLILHFDDITIPRKGYVLPQFRDVMTILQFTAQIPPESNVLIHCHQGVSRSTAAAIAIAMQTGLSYEDAFNTIKEIRPQLWPNQRMIGFVDSIFNLEGEFGRFVAEWKRMEFITKYRTEMQENPKEE